MFLLDRRIVGALLAAVMAGCGAQMTGAEKESPLSPAAQVPQAAPEAEAVADHVGAGRLDVRATDAGRHRVEVVDSAGEVIAEGWTAHAIDVPPGSYAIRVQDYELEAAVEEGRTTLVRVIDQVGMGRLDVRATDAGRHRVEVVDSAGEVIAEGWTAHAFDVPPGTHTVRVQGYEFEVTVETGRSKMARVIEKTGLGRLDVRATDAGRHRVEVVDAAGEAIAEGWTAHAFDVPPGTHTVRCQGHEFKVTVDAGRTKMVRVMEKMGLGRLGVRATDAGRHRVEVVARGAVIAEGWTAQGFDVPPGTYTIRVQGHEFEATIESGRTSSFSVVEEIGLGRLSVRATDAGRHRVEVVDSQGAVIAEGWTPRTIDVPPGTHTVRCQGYEFEVTVERGRTHTIRVWQAVGLGRLRVDVEGGGRHGVEILDADGQPVQEARSGEFTLLSPGRYTAVVQGQRLVVYVQRGRDTVVSASAP